MKFLLLVCAAFISHVAAQGTPCPTGYTFHSGKCLMNVDRVLTYTEALAECLANSDGSLAMIKSAVDDEALRSFMDSMNKDLNVWLPVVDPDGDSTFTYEDGSELNDFQPWYSDLDQTVKCAETVEYSGRSNWYTANCASYHPAVCEVQPAAPSCDYGWTHNPDDNTCLRAIRGRRRTYPRAGTYCQILGGELAKNVFKLSQRRRITRLVKFRAHFFIGLDDADNNGSYMYKDGSTMEANPPFKRGTPPNGRCVTINKKRWFAKDCNKARFFVCEKDPKY